MVSVDVKHHERRRRRRSKTFKLGPHFADFAANSNFLVFFVVVATTLNFSTVKAQLIKALEWNL